MILLLMLDYMDMVLILSKAEMMHVDEHENGHVAERVAEAKSSHSSHFLPSFLTLLRCIGDNAQFMFGGRSFIALVFIYRFLSRYSLPQISIQ